MRKQGPTYSIFHNRNAPQPAPRADAGTTLAQTESSPRRNGLLGPQGQTAQTGAESCPSTAAARTTAEAKAPGVPILHGGGTDRHAARMARRRRSTRGIRGRAQRATEAICMVPGQVTGQIGHSRLTWPPAAQDPGVGRESGNLEPRTLGRQAIPGVPGTTPHTRQPGAAGHCLDR